MSLISIIVPVYKVEPYLHRCVNSILNQTFTDFELILVDDGSPDNCGQICDEYAEKDSRIHVIHQENGGLSAARNAGIDWAFENSDSQWLAFIDSDDWVHPKYLEYLFRATQEMNKLMSVCGIKRVNKEETTPEAHFIVDCERWDTFYLNNWVRGVVAVNKLYAKALFDGLRYPVGKIHEDEYLTYKLLARAKEVSFIDEDLYYYFQNSESITNQTYHLSKIDAIYALEEQCAFAKKNGYNEFYLKKRDTLLFELVKHINDCDKSDLNEDEKKRGLRALRKELRKYLFLERKTIAQKKDKKWYYELAYPKTMWVYWSCVGILGSIKRAIKKNG